VHLNNGMNSGRFRHRMDRPYRDCAYSISSLGALVGISSMSGRVELARILPSDPANVVAKSETKSAGTCVQIASAEQRPSDHPCNGTSVLPRVAVAREW